MRYALPRGGENLEVPEAMDGALGNMSWLGGTPAYGRGAVGL